MYTTYKQLAVEQKQNLDYKIDTALEAIREGFTACRHRPALAFSGGKDSTVLWHLIRTHFPNEAARLAVIYGNTGVEYPESLQFARQLGREWGGDNFYETRPLPTSCAGLKYQAQCEVLAWMEQEGRLPELLKEDGKLKSTATLEAACPAHLMEQF